MLKVKPLFFLLLWISAGKSWAQNSLGHKEAKKDTVANVSELNEVVVTAQFEPKSIKNSIYKVKLLNADRIKLSGATSLQQVLNTEPGFRFSNDLALGVADFEMMGMGGRNIKILLDGMPVVDRSDKRESLNQIDINSIERVEIVEGPVSVIYGTDALAGVINIISKQPQQNQWQVNARLQDETVGSEYRAFSGAGSHNQHLSANWAQEKWSALAGFSRNQFGGWNIPTYTTPIDEMPITWWRPKQQYLANAKLGYKSNKVTINYRIDGLDEDIDSRFGLNPRSYVGKFQTYNTLRFTQQLQSQWVLSPKVSLTGMWGYTDLKRGTKTIYNNFATGEETLGTAAGEQDVAKFNSAIFRGIALYKINPYFSLQSGIEYNRDAASGARINGSQVINDVALFALGGIVLGRFSFLPGFRLIKNSVYPAPPIIPSFNTKIALNKNLDWRLGYAKGFRAPALRELYFDFVDASHTIYGNPNLKAEQSDSFNSSFTLTAVQKKQLSWVIDVKTFYSFIKNRIAFAQDPSNIQVTSLFNIEKYRTAGLGLEQSVVFKKLKGTVAFAYIGRYNNLLAEGIVTNTPLMMWTSELSTNISYAFSKIGTSVALFYKYTGNRPAYEKNGNKEAKLVQISDFNWADLMIDQKINPYLSLNAGVKNLFNITQLNNTSTASAGPHSSGGAAVPMSYGRSFVLGLNLTWNKLNKEK